ncbi:hypothetical protein H5410_011565 [Solanum commersonii]|uniref:Uncharacterized protein n=1 Tax=Solanum commersonii TaxID=4109 RepID=A0A9J6AQ11_SOLCO|nr:hypothetical protein H5410_011565 [Solanum commersonii]
MQADLCFELKITALSPDFKLGDVDESLKSTSCYKSRRSHEANQRRISEQICELPWLQRLKKLLLEAIGISCLL